MKKIIALCLIFLIGLCAQAQASTWKGLSGNEEVTIYVDTSTIARIGKYRKAWFLYSYKSIQPITAYPYQAYNSYRTLEYYLCEDRSAASIQAHYFNNNIPVFSLTIKIENAQFDEVVPDTFGDQMYLYVCKTSIYSK